MPSSTSIAQVRRLIYGGSTRTGTLSTGDIGWFVDNAPNVWLAASEAAASEAAAYGSGRKKVGDLEIEEGSAGGWLDLSRRLRRKGISAVSPYAGGISVADKAAQDTDSDWDRPANRLGMFDYDSVSDT